VPIQRLNVVDSLWDAYAAPERASLQTAVLIHITAEG